MDPSVNSALPAGYKLDAPPPVSIPDGYKLDAPQAQSVPPALPSPAQQTDGPPAPDASGKAPMHVTVPLTEDGTPKAETDIGKIKRNVARMAAQGAQTDEIDGYIKQSGATLDQVKNYPLTDDDKHDIIGSMVSGLGTAAAAGRTALKGATFGLSTNVIPAEMAAPVIWASKNLFTNDHPTYGQARDFAYTDANKDTEQFKKDHPVLSPVLEIGGALTTGGALAKGAGAVIDAGKALPVVSDIAGAGGKAIEVAKSVPIVGKTAVQIGKGALTGGTVAGTYGAGTEQHGDFIKGAEELAPVGAAIGAGVGVVGAAAAPFLKAKQPLQQAEKVVVSQFKNQAEKFFASQLSKRPDLKDALDKADTLQKAADIFGIKLTTAEKLAYAGTDPLLAQQGVISGNPNTGGRMAKFYADRSGQIEDAYGKVASDVHPAQTYDEAADAVIGHAKEGVKRITGELTDKASPLYDEAFQANKSVSSPLINKILNTPGGKSALGYAVESMQNQMARVAVPDKELAEVARDLGRVGKMGAQRDGVASGLKLQTLDLVKRGFDDAINDAKAASAPGTTSTKARNLMKLRGAFVNELDNLDVTGKAGPNSLKPEGGAYARARGIYSGQPDKLALRGKAGSIADINPDQPQNVARTLMSGTQKTAQQSAEALGPEGKKAAASAIIREGLETNRGAPEALVRKLAPNDRTAEQLAAYLNPEQVKALENLNDLSGRVLMGNRLVKAPSPTQERTAAEKLLEGASAAKDLAIGSKLGFIKKMAGIFKAGSREENPQFYEDMYKLMTTDEGMQLAKKIAAAKENALANPKQTLLGNGAKKNLPSKAAQAGAVVAEKSGKNP